MNNKKKVAFHSLGCKVNSYETEAMREELAGKGFEIVDFAPGADIYIINTCTVTNIADRKSRQMLHKAKKMNGEAIVIAVGCYVQAAGEELLKDEAIDIVVGTNRKSEIYNVIQEYYQQKQGKQSYLMDIAHDCDYDEMETSTVAEHTRAFIKIQDGCNQFCTYCIIPYTRGRIRSRNLEDLKKEVEKLAENGFKEVVLTGIHLSSYGKDLEEDITLLDAINTVSKIDGIERVRLGSLEQGIMTEEFVKKLSENKKICPHFHLSLQSGSAGTLKRMNRHYTPEEYKTRCEMIRKYFDKPAFTTDVIVGFPGETKEEFAETKQFLQEIGFSEMHIFKYSKRQGTVAAAMEHQVDAGTKSARSNELICLDEQLREAYKKSFVGERKKVLMEEMIQIDGEKYFVGHTMEYLKVAVKVDENDTKQDFTNVMCDVLIKKLMNKEILLAELEKIY